MKWSEVIQSCPTLCDPMDCSLPGSSVHGIFQAIVLEWTAISFSRGSSQPRDQTRVSHIVDRRFTIWATQSNLQIHCNFYQIAMAVSTELEQKNLTVCMETHKTPNSQSNLEKAKWSRRNQASWLQTLLKSYSNQNSMVLAQTQKYNRFRIESPDINPWT